MNLLSGDQNGGGAACPISVPCSGRSSDDLRSRTHTRITRSEPLDRNARYRPLGEIAEAALAGRSPGAEIWKRMGSTAGSEMRHGAHAKMAAAMKPIAARLQAIQLRWLRWLPAEASRSVSESSSN